MEDFTKKGGTIVAGASLTFKRNNITYFEALAEVCKGIADEIAIWGEVNKDKFTLSHGRYINNFWRRRRYSGNPYPELSDNNVEDFES
eukprot:Pgem_evm1s6348